LERVNTKDSFIGEWINKWSWSSKREPLGIMK